MKALEVMLLELKDTSEFMVDLAYSSLLYNNMEIAEEVIFLSGTMEDLSSKIQDATVDLGKSNPEEVAKVVVITKLQTSIMYIAEAAKSIADVVLRGLGEHPVIAMSIKESETTISVAKVAQNSIMKGRTFGDIRLSTISGMFVIAIKRDRTYIFGPGRGTQIEEGDVLIAKGPEEGVGYFKDLADGTETEF
ncbi:MAG: TrkA C-terminal domain-containing protein [Candidatus Methanomethylophilaceae archaeon]|nr:potassium channel protein [Candidatus Methanomethylophilaceae archaeon]MDD3379404.1 TrkA C-terminal domain-containing protein [Candidatus Methanomethylophilaceae archaeon]MDY0224072.1 TrkA C-terminal domain-containing protein [Candidatus Methanomethylophilaceae archaeon]